MNSNLGTTSAIVSRSPSSRAPPRQVRRPAATRATSSRQHRLVDEALGKTESPTKQASTRGRGVISPASLWVPCHRFGDGERSTTCRYRRSSPIPRLKRAFCRKIPRSNETRARCRALGLFGAVVVLPDRAGSSRFALLRSDAFCAAGSWIPVRRLRSSRSALRWASPRSALRRGPTASASSRSSCRRSPSWNIAATLGLSVIVPALGLAMPMIASDLLVGLGYIVTTLGVVSGAAQSVERPATSAVVSAVLAIHPEHARQRARRRRAPARRLDSRGRLDPGSTTRTPGAALDSLASSTVETRDHRRSSFRTLSFSRTTSRSRAEAKRRGRASANGMYFNVDFRFAHEGHASRHRRLTKPRSTASPTSPRPTAFASTSPKSRARASSPTACATGCPT